MVRPWAQPCGGARKAPCYGDRVNRGSKPFGPLRSRIRGLIGSSRPRCVRGGAVSLVVAALLVPAGIGAGASVGSTPERPHAAHAAHLDSSKKTTKRRAKRKAVEHKKVKHKKIEPAKIFSGPDGVESTSVIAENKKTGTSAWQITGAPSSGSISGFANTTYAAAGQNVTLYVSTTAPKFHVVAYRMGYYQGLGARQVFTSSTVPGVHQPTCSLTAGVNMVSCDNWSTSITILITSAFVQGDYLFKLIGTGNQQSYVLMTIWNPLSHATYLMVERSLVEQGWNTYGGYDFYLGSGPCTLGQTNSYPQCNRARVVSFDRPYSTGNGSATFLQHEYPLVRFMEQHGLDVAYVTDVTLNKYPTTALHHKAWLSLDHDETWTAPELTAAEQALAQGENIAFFGAAPLVRHARLEPSPFGTTRQEVDYRNPTEDPLLGKANIRTVTGNTWNTPPNNFDVVKIVGSLYSGYIFTSAPILPMIIYQATAWIFKNTGLANGSSVPNVIHSDINHVTAGDQPSNLQVFAHSPIPLAYAYTNQGSWNGNTYADMTYYTIPSSGSAVFESGTVNWINALNPCAASSQDCLNVAVAQITANLLAAMGAGPAGIAHPSVANTASLTPLGS